MIRALTFCLFASFWVLSGCSTQKMICPAYQSAFIHDRSVQKESFVYYNANKNQSREVLASNSKTLMLPPNDSTWTNSVVLQGPSLPIEKRNKRTRYLLLPEKSYRKALRALQTVEMKPVYPKKQTDSVDIKKALDSAARSITDTLTVTSNPPPKKTEEKDSTYVISIEKEKFNVDQDNYMWYFRKILVLPDVRIGMEEAKKENSPAVTEKKKGFFSRLFKKKKKTQDRASEATDLQAQSGDSTSTTTTTIATQAEAPKKKKGLFGFLKKKPKVATPPKSEPKKEEEEEKF
jgi:hypothetical protein